MILEKNETAKKYIQENYSGSEKLTDKDTACIGRLLGAVEHFNQQQKKAQQFAETVKAGLELREKHRAEYDRLMNIGLLKAAQEAMESVPQIVADIQAARRQLADLPGEIEKAKADFVKLSGLNELQADFQQAAEAFYRLRDKLLFVERTAEDCYRQTEAILSACISTAAATESKIKIPLDSTPKK